MLILVRHGKTSFNEDGKEKLRGWLPIPLSLEGQTAAADTASKLELVEDIQTIYCSDLVRAVQSAQEIAHVLAVPLTPTEQLRDWNTGDLAGESVMDNLPTIHKHMDEPNKKLPGGESFNTFYDRCQPILDELVTSDEIHLAVSHNRVVTLARALAANKGSHPKMDLLKRKAPVEPSGFIIIDNKWRIAYAYLPEDLKDAEIKEG